MSPGLASTFFKHSDLRSTHSKKLNSSSASPPSGTSPLEPTSKSCQAWNYKDSCSCDSPASNCASHHLCGVCKSSEHPMLHCPKRKMPIPNQQWLTEHNIVLELEFFSANSSPAVVAHIPASSLRIRMPTEPKYPFLHNWTFLFGDIIWCRPRRCWVVVIRLTYKLYLKCFASAYSHKSSVGPCLS